MINPKILFTIRVSGLYRDSGFRVYYPKGPCTQIVYTLAPKHLYRDYFKAKVYLFGCMDPWGEGASRFGQTCGAAFRLAKHSAEASLSEASGLWEVRLQPLRVLGTWFRV